MKKIIVFGLLLLTLFTFTGCKKQVDIPVDAPTTTAIVETIISTPTATVAATLQPSPSGTEIPDLQGAVKTYTDKRYKFSVEYPEKWKTIIETGPPDGGINILIEGSKNDRIDIYGQSGQISIPASNYTESAFTTKSGANCTLLSREFDNKKEMHLTFLDDNFRAASINMSIDKYKKYEKEIMGILRSIKLL